MIDMSDSRTIYLNSNFGRRQLRETLGSLLMGMILVPDDVWLVSPWISDFDLIDNRTGLWDSIQPGWGSRIVRFSEILCELLNTGTQVKVVTNGDSANRTFLKKLAGSVVGNDLLRSGEAAELHVKGLLAKDFFIAGSMNFTYSGTNINEEQVQLSSNPSLLIETRLEFEKNYMGALA